MADFDWSFFIEVLVGGLLSGVMYSLVAIGFVLIYKTSGVLNFAQGAMLLFAALTFVSLVERGLPFVAALPITIVIMGLLAVAIERAVLRPLVNKPPITLFMATLGLSYMIEGGAQLLWGTQVHGLDLGIDDAPFEIHGVLVSTFDLFAAGVAGLMVAALSAFFRYTRIGLAFRAVADDQFAATAVGLSLPRIWATVWTAAGIVALVAGLLWGARLGVQFSLSLVVLKALPVLVLGGFDSILGAIVGGLLIGAFGVRLEARRRVRDDLRRRRRSRRQRHISCPATRVSRSRRRTARSSRSSRPRSTPGSPRRPSRTRSRS